MLYHYLVFDAMKNRREFIITDECEKGGLHLPIEIVGNIMSYVYPVEHSVERACVRVDCNAVAAPNPDPKRRKSKYDNFTCNNADCARHCAWYERVGDTFVRCDAVRYEKNSVFCGSGWCNTLYKDNGGTTQTAFMNSKRERENEDEVFA